LSYFITRKKLYIYILILAKKDHFLSNIVKSSSGHPEEQTISDPETWDNTCTYIGMFVKKGGGT
jgi:hypothetical protein